MLKAMAQKTALITPGYILYSALNSPPQCVEASPPTHRRTVTVVFGTRGGFKGTNNALTTHTLTSH